MLTQAVSAHRCPSQSGMSGPASIWSARLPLRKHARRQRMHRQAAGPASASCGSARGSGWSGGNHPRRQQHAVNDVDVALRSTGLCRGHMQLDVQGGCQPHPLAQPSGGMQWPALDGGDRHALMSCRHACGVAAPSEAPTPCMWARRLPPGLPDCPAPAARTPRRCTTGSLVSTHADVLRACGSRAAACRQARPPGSHQHGMPPTVAPMRSVKCHARARAGAKAAHLVPGETAMVLPSDAVVRGPRRAEKNGVVQAALMTGTGGRMW